VVEHAYDADGNRVRTELTPANGPPVVTDYLVDTSGALSQVVAETDGAGALRAYYVRGDDLLAVMRPLVPVPATAADWQTRYYHADGIGSVRRLTDETGAVTDTYTYSAFGELLSHTGTDPQPYAFAGEPYDPNAGFQYHRARWMDPRAGRFASTDRWRGSPEDPRSLHTYLYALANPAVLADPTGLFSQAFGYAVEDAIEPLYMADHIGHAVVFGRWNRVGLNPRLKPDILNYTTLQYLEIKPLSYSGVMSAVFKMGIYAASFTWAGFYPDFEWEPPNGGLVKVGSADVLVFNVAGVLFYTDALELATELVTIVAVSDAFQLLRSARLLGSAVFEGARIARLAATATGASQSRVNAALPPAFLLATHGVI
jgi:RHS repeat-associated protein